MEGDAEKVAGTGSAKNPIGPSGVIPADDSITHEPPWCPDPHRRLLIIVATY